MAAGFRARLLELHGIGADTASATEMLAAFDNHKGCAACVRARTR
jgi:hypothetical protein